MIRMAVATLKLVRRLRECESPNSEHSFAHRVAVYMYILIRVYGDTCDDE